MQENKLEMKDFVPNLLRRTEIPCMRLKLVDTTPGIAESKFGGRGYVPHDAAIPTNSEGVQMRLLAQIDCRQITIPDFPTSGLLQFWAINDDLTGCNFDNNTEQKDFRICYYETVDPTVTEEEVAAKEGNHQPCEEDEEDFFPIDGCFGLKFEQTTDRMSMCDYHFWGKNRDSSCGNFIRSRQEQLLADEDAKEAFEEELEEYLDEQDEQDRNYRTGCRMHSGIKLAVIWAFRRKTHGILQQKMTTMSYCCKSIPTISEIVKLCGAIPALPISLSAESI